MSRFAIRNWAVMSALTLTGCAVGNTEVLRTDESSMAIRSYQSRVLEVEDANTTMRAVIATLQDFDFVIDNVESQMGTLTATRLEGHRLRMTVIVKPRGERRFQVRASAQNNDKAVEDPEVYQTFFTALQKSIFLNNQGVD